MAFYINCVRRSDKSRQTINEFSTMSQAHEELVNCRITDPKNLYFITHKPCDNWNKSPISVNDDCPDELVEVLEQ